MNPARIRLNPHGQVKLTDFGVALSRLVGRLATSLPRPQGEVLYAAPEMLLGEVVDARADLFSLGLTIERARTIAASTRHPDEVTTAPGGGPHRSTKCPGKMEHF